MTPRQFARLGALALLWGASYLLIKYGLEDLSPGMIVFARLVLAVLVLFAVVRAQGGEAWARMGDARARPGTAILLGAAQITVPFLLISFGEQEIPSGLTGVLLAAVPLWVAVMAPFVDRSETIGGRQAAGLLVGLAGVALIVGVETVHSLGQFLGAMAMIGAAACYATGSFFAKRHYAGFPPLTTSLLAVTAGAVLAAPLALAAPPTEAPGARAVIAVVVLGVAGTAAAFVVFYGLLADVGAGRTQLVGYLIPPVSLAYGAVLLDEPVTAAAIAGLVLILAGVALASRGGPVAGEQTPVRQRADDR